MTWRVTYDRGTAFVHGPKTEARRRIAACGDRSPIWTRHREAWATSPAVASLVLDQLEARNIPAGVDHADQSMIQFAGTLPANHDTTPEQLW
jgi:hypothetical protein